jgi:serine/threonine-protein kinase
VAAPVPARLGRYQIEKEIGRGMMGVVYRAHDPDLGRTVALKTVSIPGGALDAAQRESFEQRFLAEARAAAALSHPAIVVVHDVGRDPETGTAYIALEFLEGRTLAERLERDGRLPIAEALRLAARLAEGLHHAHSRGVVHRDIKPANIMALSTGDVKIMDFGIAKLPTSQLTAAGELFGTPSYMSPEQALNRPVDGRSDLFSLGCVLYAMLTGERAFNADSVPLILAMIAHKDAPPPSVRRPELPEGVDAIVARVLAKDPDRRYPDGKALAEDLDDVAQGRPPRHRPADYVVTAAEGTIAPGAAAAEARPPLVPSPPRLDFSTPAVPARAADTGDGAPRRRVAIVAALGLLLLVGGSGAGLYLVRTLRAHGVAVPLPVPSGELEIALTHSLKSGTVRVFVDDDLRFEDDLESRVTQKILSVEIRKGALKKTIDVPTGEHVIRVQVQGGTFSDSRRITGTFTSGGTRHLQVEVGGLLKREISLVWMD